jgi:DNA polymerase-3 subunit gamma/tau
VGKTTCARILAKKINEDGSQKEGEDFAFNIFELDAASNNSVDDIRNLIDQVRIPPQVGKYKVYIIDEVHMLSQAAFNAFLKTLEEPPRHAIFILATTEKHKIIPTILSRCQIFDFRRITVGDAVKYLQYIAQEQGITAEEDALHIIAQKADGAMRDALSIFDRVVSFAGTTLTRKAVAENLNVLDVEVYFRVTDLILDHDIPGLLLYFNQVLSSGFEGHHFISGLGSHFRDLMVCRDPQTVSLLETSENIKKQYLDQSRRTDSDFLLQALELATRCELDYKASSNHRLLVELCLMQLASLGVDEKKKDHKPVPLIPASRYRGQEREIEQAPLKAPPTLPDPGPVEVAAHEKAAPANAGEVPENRPEKPRIAVDPERAEKVSALSLSSIRAKKLHEAQKKAHLPVEEALPEDPIEEEALRRHWDEFTRSMEEKGRKILASSLAMDLPKVKEDHTIWIELPNLTMKKEVEREQQELMGYLKKSLNNYSLQLKITVNEEAARQFAFTPEEKYQKLREKNPALDLLRKTFDLDL